MSDRGSRARSRTRGQSLVEFALILPIALLILASAADFGRAFTAYIEIGSAARSGAAYGSQSITTAANTGGIQAAALADAPDIWGVRPTVPGAVVGTDSYGYKYVEVTVSYTFRPVMASILAPAIGSRSVVMNRTVRMRVIN